MAALGVPHRSRPALGNAAETIVKIQSKDKQIMTETRCPACNAIFDADENRKYEGISADFQERLQRVHTSPEKWVDESSLVSCPRCGNSFVSDSIRFFGIFSPRGLKILIGLFVLGFLGVVLYLVLLSIIKF